MGWTIKCADKSCGKVSQASNIVDLIKHHCDADGWFVCSHCKGKGYIEKSFDLQEPGETWKPYLRGVIPLGTPGETYQPFVFLVSYSPTDVPCEVWFSYYKDTRPIGGRLKLGYGPGGPPVLEADQILQIIKAMIKLKCLDINKVKMAISI